MPRTSCPPISLVLPADHASSLGAGRYLVAPRVKDLATTPSGGLVCVGENQKDGARTTVIPILTAAQALRAGVTWVGHRVGPRPTSSGLNVLSPSSTRSSESPDIAGWCIGPDEVDRMPACWDRSAEQIRRHARVICASTFVEEEPVVGKLELIRRGLGVGPGDPEIPVGMASVGRCHSHTGDAFDVGDRCVTDPVRTDAEFGGPRQVLDASSESLEPLVVEMATVPSMQDDRAPMVAQGCGRRGGRRGERKPGPTVAWRTSL